MLAGRREMLAGDDYSAKPNEYRQLGLGLTRNADGAAWLVQVVNTRRCSLSVRLPAGQRQRANGNANHSAPNTQKTKALIHAAVGLLAPNWWSTRRSSSAYPQTDPRSSMQLI
jgi:hypothetical protein